MRLILSLLSLALVFTTPLRADSEPPTAIVAGCTCGCADGKACDCKDCPDLTANPLECSVMVRRFVGNEIHQGSGTVVHIDKDTAVILTNAHVAPNVGDNYDVVVNGVARKARWLSTSEHSDLGAVVCEAKGLKAVEVVSMPPPAGTQVRQIGFGDGRFHDRRGYGSGYVGWAEGTNDRTYHLRLNVLHGDSGSGVFTQEGLVAVVWASANDRPDLTICVGAQEIHRFLQTPHFHVFPRLAARLEARRAIDAAFLASLEKSKAAPVVQDDAPVASVPVTKKAASPPSCANGQCPANAGSSGGSCPSCQGVATSGGCAGGCDESSGSCGGRAGLGVGVGAAMRARAGVGVIRAVIFAPVRFIANGGFRGRRGGCSGCGG